MTTPAASPASPESSSPDASPSGDDDSGEAPGEESPPGRRRDRWLHIVALGTSLLVLAGSGTAWYFYRQLDGNIQTDVATATELRQVQADRPEPLVTEAENILLIGSDNRGDGNGEYGADSGTQRSDTTILLHLTADRSSATAVSIPRDLMAGIPSCKRPDGTRTTARLAQFNWSFEFGGAACTIRTVEKLTDIRIDDHLIVDFTGFKNMVDAVDGVEVCVPHAVHDEDALLDLKAGRQKLHGEQALGYVRSRKGLGDGSDTQRMDRQQQFLASLVNKVRSNGVLLNPAKLYPLLDAATSSLTASEGLDSLTELYDLARGLQKTPTSEVRFLTVPRQPYTYDPNRDELIQPEAGKLFTALREDRSVGVTESGTPSGTSDDKNGKKDDGKDGDEPGGTTDGKAVAGVPTYRGTTADHDICGQEE